MFKRYSCFPSIVRFVVKLVAVAIVSVRVVIT